MEKVNCASAVRRVQVQGTSAGCSRDGLDSCWREVSGGEEREPGRDRRGMLVRPCKRPFTVNVQKAHPHCRARANITVQENKSGSVSGSWAKLCWPRARSPLELSCNLLRLRFSRHVFV